jgi:hypothetical protein
MLQVWFWHAACDFHTRAYGLHTLHVEQLYYDININLICRHIAAAV